MDGNHKLRDFNLGLWLLSLELMAFQGHAHLSDVVVTIILPNQLCKLSKTAFESMAFLRLLDPMGVERIDLLLHSCLQLVTFLVKK